MYKFNERQNGALSHNITMKINRLIIQGFLNVDTKLGILQQM